MRSILAVLYLITAFLATGCESSKLKRYEFSEYLMHTTYKITLYSTPSGQKAKSLANQAFKICRELENKYSTTLSNSLVAQLNRKGKINIDSETYSILKKAQELSEISGGKFDITVYPLMKIWGFYRSRQQIPSSNEISAALKSVSYQNIILSSNSIQLLNGAKIDLGGILKGYAVNKMIGFLKSKNVPAGIVDAGGNLGIFGSKPDQSKWNIGVRHPRKEGIYTSIEMSPDFSIATSGDYEQFLITNKARYSHIMDPQTGYPLKSPVLSVSIIRPYPENPDGYSCTFFLMGPEAGIAYADKHGIPVYYIIETNFTLYSAQSIWWK